MIVLEYLYVALAKSCTAKKRFVTKWTSISMGLFVLFELVCRSCVKRALVTSFSSAAVQGVS